MLQVHLDTDIGSDIDDLCALTMLLNLRHVEITGITTVGEHQGIRAGLVQSVLELAERDIPVAAGADIASHPYSITPWFLPLEKYWLGPVTRRPGSVDRALRLLKRSIEKGAVIIGIGSYTNLALLETKHPGILATAKIVLMGSYLPFEHNPLEPLPWFVPEHNFQSDPQSSRVVLEKAQPLFVPLNVTTQTALCKSHLKKLAHAGAVGALIAHQAQAHLRQFHFDQMYGGNAGLPEDLINFLHDALACAVATGWEKVEYEEYCFSWDVCGEYLISRLDPKGKSLKFVTSVQAKAFNDYWLSTCCTGVQESISHAHSHLLTGKLENPLSILAPQASLTS